MIAQPRVPLWPEPVIEENVTMEEVQQVDFSEDEALQVAETSTVKGKGKARSKSTSQGRERSRSQLQQAGPAIAQSTSQASLKRDLQASSSREQGHSVKRVRTDPVVSPRLLDLRSLHVNEGDLVKEQDVPKVAMKVSLSSILTRLSNDRFQISCTSCVGQRDDCAPRWVLNKDVPKIKCRNCFTQRLGCSFASAMNWGIEHWPNIAKAPATRKVEASQVAKSLPDGSELGAADPALSELTTELQNSSITESFQLEDYSTYFEAISDPARSPASLGSALAEVTRIFENERDLLRTLKKKVLVRATRLEALRVQLDTEGARLLEGVKTYDVAEEVPQHQASKRGGRRRKLCQGQVGGPQR